MKVTRAPFDEAAAAAIYRVLQRAFARANARLLHTCTTNGPSAVSPRDLYRRYKSKLTAPARKGCGSGSMT